MCMATEKVREPVVLYSRYSSLNQDENSLAYQRSAAESYCKRHNMELVKIYSDEACTGTNDQRPEFQRMIQDAQMKPTWRKIVVYKLSRFSRNTSDQMNYEALLKKAGIEVISITEHFADTPLGRHERRVQASHNQLVSEETGEQTFSGMMERAKEGYHCGGCPPLGYMLRDGRLAIEEEEAETVRLIFQMYLDGYSYAHMAKCLNEQGRCTKNGSRFTKNSFNSILTQEKYAGTYIWNKASHKAEDGTRNSHAHKPESEQVRIEGGCPAIVDRETFDKVQEKMKGHKGGNRVQHHYMLTSMGKLVCAHCGHTMQGRTAKARNGEKYTVYACPNHHGAERTCPTKDIRADYLDWFVLFSLITYRFQEDDLPQLSKQVSCGDEISRLKKRRGELKRAIEADIALWERCPSDEIWERYNRNNDALNEVNSRLERFQSGEAIISMDNINDVANQMEEYLKTSDDLLVREYLSKHIATIRYGNDSVELCVETG